MHDSLTFLARYGAPVERVWSVIADHVGMSRWTVFSVEILEGDGGARTVRRLRAWPWKVDERIEVFEPPKRMVYRIIRGLPLDHHRGEIRLEPWGTSGTKLWWDISFASRIPGATRFFKSKVQPGLAQALRALGTLVE